MALEDFFHGRALAEFIDSKKWPRFENRFEQNTERTLELLARYDARATFFVMGWVAEQRPDLVREIANCGHEIASSGYARRSFHQFTPDEFREDLRKSRDILEGACNRRVIGFRASDHRLREKDLWALRVLAEEGYVYDSSLTPSLRAFNDQPWRKLPHQVRYGEHELWEFPLPSVDVLGLTIPIAGGNFIRQYPKPFTRSALARWHAKNQGPFVLYFRVWDLDPEQPVITGAPLLARLRHYRHPDRMPELLASLLAENKYRSISDFLQIPPQTVLRREAGSAPASVAGAAPGRTTSGPVVGVTVVVPCFNEGEVLSYLGNTLRGLQAELQDRYELFYVLVDDGSSDGTWTGLEKLKLSLRNCDLIRHHRNQGVAGAILTGIRHARTEIVCSMDCDCTYNPHELAKMIPLLERGVDLVTASPYHPRGAVLNVPSWRLVLSRTASLLYSKVLKLPICTYTSCFRVYRRERVLNLQLRERGFIGVAEILGVLALGGARIVEHPTTLEVRVLGQSKIRILRTIVGHIRLLSHFAMCRLGVSQAERRTSAKTQPAA